MKVIKAAARQSKPARADYFTGTVWMNEVVVADGPSRLNASLVTFSPGARTNWHTHPIGQVLYVTSGVGRVQKEGEAPILLHPGDTVVIPPDVVHWHGAAPDQVFSHLAMWETEGAGTVWLHEVADADYTAPAVLPG
jgi:quercetin dioxygenase-like cupin family protein